MIMNTKNISFGELVKAVSNGKSYIKKHFDIDNTLYNTTINVNEFQLVTYQNEVAVFKHIPTMASVRVKVLHPFIDNKVEKVEIMPQGKKNYVYEVEMALIVGMSKYLELNIKNCYKTTNLSYDLLKTKFLNKAFEKEILTKFKK